MVIDHESTSIAPHEEVQHEPGRDRSYKVERSGKGRAWVIDITSPVCDGPSRYSPSRINRFRIPGSATDPRN